jgi:hypothetical protein
LLHCQLIAHGLAVASNYIKYLEQYTLNTKGKGMGKTIVSILAVVAVFFAAASVSAATCADWKGTWIFTYNDNKTDTVVIASACMEASCYPDLEAKSFLACWATGKKQSDNQSVQIIMATTVPEMYQYYEEDNITKFNSSDSGPPFDQIKTPQDFDGCSFTATQETLQVLKSGVKSGCSASATTTSISYGSTTTTAQAATTTIISTTTTTGLCPAQMVLGADSSDLENLRAFRDGTLAQSAVGRRIIEIYYNKADSINSALVRRPALRAVTRRVLELLAPMVEGAGIAGSGFRD